MDREAQWARIPLQERMFQLGDQFAHQTLSNRQILVMKNVVPVVEQEQVILRGKCGDSAGYST